MKMSNQESCFCLTQLQILMSVALEKTTVTGMQNVQTLLVALSVIVAKDMLEMVCNVEVSFVLLVHLLSKALQVLYYGKMTSIPSRFFHTFTQS